MTNSGRRGQSGAAALEFALILPIFVLILYGLITFGSIFYTQMILSRAAADGARSLGTVAGISNFDGVPEPVKDSIKLEVVHSLAQSLIAPLGLGDYGARQTWLEENIMPQMIIDQGGCGAGGDSNGTLRVRIVYPYNDVRILPPLRLPLIGDMADWMPQTLIGCAVAQL